MNTLAAQDSCTPTLSASCPSCVVSPRSRDGNSSSNNMPLLTVGHQQATTEHYHVGIDVGDIPPGTTRWYMGRTIRGGPAREIKAYMARLQVVLDIVIVPNMILYL